MKIKNTLQTILALLLISTSAWARLEYVASELLLKNSEQFYSIVRKKIKKAQDIQAKQDPLINDDGQLVPDIESVSILRDAMRITLSRPDQDGARPKIFNQVRQDLNEINSLNKVLNDITDEGLAALKAKEIGIKQEETYVLILDNLLAEIKPEVNTNTNFKSIVEKIKNANIVLSQKMKDPNRSIAINNSPSKTAESILNEKK